MTTRPTAMWPYSYGVIGPYEVQAPTEAEPALWEQLQSWLAGHPLPDSVHYEIIYGGGFKRGYAENWEGLCTLLIPGYAEAGDEAQRTELRLRYSVSQQVIAQSLLLAAATPDQLSHTAPEELALLRQTRSEPIVVDRWRAEIPMVLVTWWYAPYSQLARPDGVELPESPSGTNLWWIDPVGEESLILSLAQLGLIGLAEREVAVVP